MNKTKLLICSVLLIMSSIGVCFAESVKITKITFKPAPRVQSVTINDMSEIQAITTAGKYAWAYGYNDEGNAIAFYNGDRWLRGINVSEYWASLVIDYPDTAKDPSAWILSIEQKTGLADDYRIKHFDGSGWIGLYTVSELLGVPCGWINDIKLNGKGGYLYLTMNYYGMLYTIYNPNTKQWSEPKMLSTEPSSYCGTNRGMIGAEDDPKLIIECKRESGSDERILTVYEINKQGSVRHDELYVSNQFEPIIRTANNTITIIDDREGNFIYKNINADDKWHQINIGTLTAMPPTNFLYIDNHQKNNLLCVALKDDVSYDINCVDLSQPDLGIKHHDLQSYHFGSTFKMRSGGAWMVHKINHIRVSDYDFLTNTMVDTNFETKKYGLDLKFRSVDPGILFACEASDKMLTTKLKYYDRNANKPQWTLINNEVIRNKKCDFSYPDNILETNNEEVIWLYDGPRPWPYVDKNAAKNSASRFKRQARFNKNKYSLD